MLLLCLLASLGAAQGVRHTIANVSIYPSYDSIGVPVIGNRLLFAGGKGTSRQTVLFDVATARWSLAGLTSRDRAEGAGTATPDGRTALIAGGEDGNKTKFGTVDAFDATTGAWTTLPNISVPRSFLAATTVTDPATGRVYSLFGGGEVLEGPTGTDSARVDIYDHAAHAWIAHKELLSAPRKKLAAASAQGIAMFGGGYTSGEKNATHRGYQDVVDVFHAKTMSWSTAQLTQPRQYIVAAATDDKIIFAGGFCSPCLGQPGTDRSNVIDIYDVASNTWKAAKMSQCKVF